MSIRNGHIRWAFNLSNWRPTLPELLTATSCIQQEEKLRLSAFMFRDDFDASIIGRLLMRKFVHDATKQPYEKIIFHRDERGKPYLPMHHSDTNQISLTFNVSHQGNYTIIAGSIVDKPLTNANIIPRIGADIMKIEYTGGKSLEEFFRIMTRNFSATEWNYINKQSTEQLQLQAFMRHWCLKESFVKMLGSGITVPLDKISFTIYNDYLMPANPMNVITNSTVTQSFDELTNSSNLQFEESQLDDDHCVAVLLCDHNNDINYKGYPFEIISFEELTKGCKPLLHADIDYCKSIIEKVYKSR